MGWHMPVQALLLAIPLHTLQTAADNGCVHDNYTIIIASYTVCLQDYL